MFLYFCADGVVSRSHCPELPLLGRYWSDFSGELCVNFQINGPVLDSGTRRVFAKIVIAFPILGRSDRSRHKTAAAVRTDVAQDGINTRRTKRTLIATDARLK